MNRILLVIVFILSFSQGRAQIIGNPKGIIYGMSVDPQSHRVAVIQGREKVEVWNYQSKSLEKSWGLNERALALSLTKDWLAVGFKSGKVLFYFDSNMSTVAEIAVSDKPLKHMLLIDDKKLAVSDAGGVVYILETSLPTVSVKKLITDDAELTDLEYIPSLNVIALADAKGKIRLRSLTDGALIREESIGDFYIFDIQYGAVYDELYAAYSKGRVATFKMTNKVIALNDGGMDMTMNGWITCFDRREKVSALGSIREVKIFTERGTYHQDQKAIVNQIQIIIEDLPVVRILVGTQGRGLMILDTKQMHVLSNKFK